jgi:6-phosphofructokinase 1
MARFNALYAQSGGVTAVINASAAGVIEAWRRAARKDSRLGKLFAGRNGIVGVLAEDLIDTTRETDAAIAGLRHVPGGAFGSCRFKLAPFSASEPAKAEGKGAAQFDRLLEVFRAHGIRYFFYNGGGDSADTCLKVAQLAVARGYPLQAIHVPKTIDNDLPLTDTCPGFGSVAKYVAVSTREASLDVASMCSTSTRVFVLEVMGRHAGWIAAAAGLADTATQPLPLVILLPEVPFDETRFLDAVRAKVEAHGYCTVVASEGTHTADGKFLSDQGLRDAFGHAQLGGVAPVLATLVKDQLKLKVHWAVSDYLQRSARHVASATDLAQAVAVGKAGVALALKGRNQVMATIERTADKPYAWRVGAVPLEQVANVERKMPATFIGADGYSITPAARTYLAPLIQGEAKAPWRDGLPLHPTLKLVAVPKKLAAFAP